MSRPKTDIEKSIRQELPEFYGECQSLSQEQIDARLAQLVKDENSVDLAQHEDVELDETKKLLQELSAPYREARDAIKLKSAYLCYLLAQRGA